jgi:tRNA wybutosine-synthesizing protein 1
MGWERDYAKLDEVAEPMFIEPKGYVFVGGSRARMSMDNMPAHRDVIEFGARVGSELGMEVLKDKPDSRVCALGAPGAITTIPGLEG